MNTLLQIYQHGRWNKCNHTVCQITISFEINKDMYINGTLRGKYPSRRLVPEGPNYRRNINSAPYRLFVNLFSVNLDTG